MRGGTLVSCMAAWGGESHASYVWELELTREGDGAGEV